MFRAGDANHMTAAWSRVDGKTIPVFQGSKREMMIGLRADQAHDVSFLKTIFDLDGQPVI